VSSVDAFIVSDVGARDLHDVVSIASHEVAGHDVGRIDDGGFERIEGCFLLTGKRDLDKCRGASTDGSRVEECDIAVNDPL